MGKYIIYLNVDSTTSFIIHGVKTDKLAVQLNINGQLPKRKYIDFAILPSGIKAEFDSNYTIEIPIENFILLDEISKNQIEDEYFN